MSMTRRDLFKGVACTAVFCGIGGISFVGKTGDGLLRPPGAQDEDAFIGLCIKCDRCRSVCPHDCVGVGRLEDGLISARTPVMDFHRGLCDFCDRCREVCPTGAIGGFDKDVDKIGIAVIREDRCVAWKNPGTCVKCEDACEYDAVSIVDGIPVVDEERCNGCGACEFACPALVYTSLSDGSDRGIVVYTVDEAHAMMEES